MNGTMAGKQKTGLHGRSGARESTNLCAGVDQTSDINSSDITNKAPMPAGFEHITNPQNGYGQGPQVINISKNLDILCGPLLNYNRMSNEQGQVFWHGSILIVTKPGEKQPKLLLRSLGPTDGTAQKSWSSRDSPEVTEGLKLYADPIKAFWRFTIRVPVEQAETRWEYNIPDMAFMSKVKLTGPSRTFVVPSVNDSMRIMFHSCNGFSVGTDEEEWSGPVLWNDVLRIHERKPFHVMLGGGDQV